MARIGENAFRQYRDGQDRLTAPEYMAERELIRLAVNDLDDKVQRTEGIREEFTNTVNEVETVKGEVVQTKQEVETRIGEFAQTIDQTAQELQHTSQELQQTKEEVSQVGVHLADIAINVETFSGSDTQKIQAALNTGKSIILEKNKVYDVVSMLNIVNSNQKIIGNGAVLNNVGSIDKLINISGTPTGYIKNVVIEDLQILVGTITVDTVNGQIHCSYVDGIVIDKCIVKATTSATTAAIFFNGVINSVISNCLIEEFKRGMFVRDSYNSETINNRFICNRIPSNWTDGFYAINYDDYNTKTRTVKNINVTNNYISGYSLSISIRFGTKCIVSRNTIVNTAFGVTIDRTSFTNVTSNIIEIAASATNVNLYIELVCSNDCVVSDNQLRCDNYLGTGIGVYGDPNVANYNEPINNVISNNNINHTNQGIVVKDNAQNTVVNGNSITDCDRGIHVHANNINKTVVSNNAIKTCSTYGIVYTDTVGYKAGVLHIKNNYIRDCNNSLYGSETNAGQSTCYIEGNTVVHSLAGRAVYGCFSNCYLIANTVKHIEPGYIGIGLTSNTNVANKPVWLLRNTIMNAQLKIWGGNEYTTHQNVLVSGLLSKSGSPTINEISGITY